MAIDTSMFEKGISISFMAIGAGVALGAMQDLTKTSKKHKKTYICPGFKPYKPYFKPIRW